MVSDSNPSYRFSVNKGLFESVTFSFMDYSIPSQFLFYQSRIKLKFPLIDDFDAAKIGVPAIENNNKCTVNNAARDF